MPTASNTIDIEGERAVEEVHCTDCGVPITSLPSWYATVRVKFVCDSCRQKSGRGLAAMVPTPILDTAVDTVRTGALGDDVDLEAEPAIDDLDVDELDIEDADLEPATEE